MTKFRHWRFMATVALGASLMLVAGGCDWLQAAFDGGGSNANPYEANLTATTVPTLTQRYTLASTTAPIVADGALYAGTSTGVSAVRARDGLPIWTATLPVGGAFGIAEDEASGTVIASAPGTLYGLDAATGTIRWSDPIANLDSGPVIDSGKIFAVTVTTDSASSPPYFLYDDSVIAIDPASGSTLWTSGFQSNDFPGRPIAGSGTVAVDFTITGTPGTPSSNEPEATNFSETDGSGGIIQETKVVMKADGLVYGFEAPNGSLETLMGDPSAGTILWSVPGLGPSPDAMSTDLFISGLTALSSQTGATKWTASLPSGSTITARPVIAGTLVYLVGTNGTSSTLYALDGATGAQVAAVPVAGGAATSSQLVISEGLVFVTVNGTITAYAPTS